MSHQDKINYRRRERTRNILKLLIVSFGAIYALSALAINEHFAAVFIAFVTTVLLLFTHFLVPLFFLIAVGAQAQVQQFVPPILNQDELELTLNHIIRGWDVERNNVRLYAALEVDCLLHLPQFKGEEALLATMFNYSTLQFANCDYWYYVEGFQYNPKSGEVLGFTLKVKLYEP